MAKMMAREMAYRFDCIGGRRCNCNHWYHPGMKVLGKRIQRRAENRQWRREVQNGQA